MSVATTLIELEKIDAFLLQEKRVSAVMFDADYCANSVLERQIEKFIEKGTIDFISVGDLSEQLHDFIDDVFIKHCDKKGAVNQTILTTYFSSDDLDEAFFYLFNLTTPIDVDEKRLLVISKLDSKIANIVEDYYQEATDFTS